MSLFQLGDFTLHGGQKSNFKIDCDALTADDWHALALLAVDRFGNPSWVEGVPRGGLAFAEALRPLCQAGGAYWIVDDAFTTGKSMREHRDHRLWTFGVVVFARQPAPLWIKPLFTMSSKL